tara:strand:- start:2673 stop:3374 length:702 start_codon:yes stop_codon:yes gene_type:complete
MSNFKRKRFTNILLLMLLAFIICYQSLQSMRANAWYFNSLNLLDQSESLITHGDLILAEQAITLATRLDPTHPHYWQISAYIKTLVFTQINENNNQHFLKYNEVELELLKSLQYRQAWANTWIELAKVVSYQEGASDRVYTYIQMAKKTGPFNLYVQLGIIQIGLMNWQQLSPSFKALYISELKLATLYGKEFDKAFEIARQVNKIPLLCLSLKFGRNFKPVRERYIYQKNCN